ncbi:hypothetical protein BOX15_Mlig032470g5, partial [Macrostomum lignano]
FLKITMANQSAEAPILLMIVSRFTSPSDFCCYLPDKIADVSQQLQTALYVGELSPFTQTFPPAGQLVVFCRNSQYYRAEVTNTLDSGLVQLTLLDTGEIVPSVRMRSMYNLPHRFALDRLPACQLRLSLRGVTPLALKLTDLATLRLENVPVPDQPDCWTPYSVDVCREAIKQSDQRILVANPQLHGTDGRWQVDAWLPGSQPKSLAQLLIEKNCAVSSTTCRSSIAFDDPAAAATATATSAQLDGSSNPNSPGGKNSPISGDASQTQPSPLKVAAAERKEIVLSSGQRVLVPEKVSRAAGASSRSPSSSVHSGSAISGGGDPGDVSRPKRDKNNASGDLGSFARQKNGSSGGSDGGSSSKPGGKTAATSNRSKGNGAGAKSPVVAAAAAAGGKGGFRDASDLLRQLRAAAAAETASASSTAPASTCAPDSASATKAAAKPINAVSDSSATVKAKPSVPVNQQSPSVRLLTSSSLDTYETFFGRDYTSAMDVRMLDYSVLILSNLNPPLEPAITFSDTNLSTEYASALSLHGFRNLKPGQTYLASAVKRGTNALLISGEGKGKSAACLMTALTLVEQPLRNLPSRTHPTCIWVCKNWITAKDTYNFAKKLVSSTHLKVAPLLDDGCIADAEIAIAATGCQLLVAAIKPLVRLLSSELASPMRNICYLLLDDLDVMLRDSKDGLKELLLAHRAALFDRRGDGKDLLPRQVIATATRWTPELDDFLRCDLSPMRSAVEIFESRTQAAIRCGVMHLVQPPNSLIDTLSNLEAGLRVAICVEEETAARALYHQLHRDLATKVYPQLIHSELDADGTKLLINAWKQMRTNCVKVLIIPDCLIMQHRLDDADALVMLDLPVGPCFTSRFCLLGAAMRRFDPDDNSGRQRPPRCFYTWSDELEFVSKPVAKRLKHFYDFLSSCVAYSSKSVPGGEDLRQLLELPDDASGAAAVDELDRSLCRTLLSFGRCGRLKCSDLRHRIVQKRDAPPRRLPVSGSTIRFKVLQVFSGNWVTIHLLGESYLLNQMSLAMHFANERNTRIGKSGEPKVGEVCAAHLEGSGYHRVKIREVQEPTSSTDTRRVTLDLVDSGRTVLRYPAGDLLALPESLSLHAVPPMSINAVILNLAPGCSAGSKNREFDWDLYSLEYLKTLTDGVELTARVAFAIGEWLLLADVEHYEPLPASGLETGFSLMQRMIESGGASFNPEHERNLLRLCQGQLDVKGPPPDSRWISRYFSYDASSASLPVAQLTEGDLVMIVGSPIRPDKFHACRDADWDNLWKMQDEIESFTSMFKPVPADCLRPGLLVLAPYQGDSGDEPPSLNRACIVTVDSGDIRPDNNSSCTVNFVDFGDQQPAALSELRLLPDQYRRLPAQAIACCLAHCSPADPAAGWSDQAVADFTDMFFDNCEPPNRKVYSVRIVSKEASQQEYRPDSSGRPRYTVQLSGTLEDRQFDPAFELVRARHAALHSVYLLSRLGLPSDWRPGQTNGGGGIRELAAQILLGNGDSPPSLLVDAAQIVVANDNSDNVELLSNALVALLLLMSHLTAEADVACVLEALSELLVGRPAKVAQLLSASNSVSELLAMLTACLDRNQGGGPAHAPAARVLRLALSASPEMTAAMRSRLDLVPLLGRELVGEAAAEFCRCCGHLLAGDPTPTGMAP